MRLDQRLAQAVRHVADGVAVPEVDLDAVRARARANRRRTAALVAGVAVVAVVVAGTAVVTGRDASSSLPPAGPVSPSVSESPSTSPLPPLETRSWEVYDVDPVRLHRRTSSGLDRGTGDPGLDLGVRRPDHLSPAHEAFLSPNGHVRVSVWNAPLDASTRQESIPYLVAWVEDYCEEWATRPAPGSPTGPSGCAWRRGTATPVSSSRSRTMSRPSSAGASTPRTR